MGSKKFSLIFFIAFFILSFLSFTREARAATYYSSGTITSVNLLSLLGVKTINSFGYNVSLIPANTGIKVQFSQDGLTWKNSSGVVSGWDTLSQGDYTAEGSDINLSGLNWKGGNFYYQTEFDTSDSGATPVLDNIVVYYSPGVYITTQTASVVYPTGATANGDIIATADGNATVRGFKYGLTQADTWDVHENGSFTPGAYSLNITGLSPNTTYFVRAYATNPDGTSYGDYTSFTTGIYSPSATITSTNLLLGQTVTTIDEFDYTLSAKPGGTRATIQFSQNGTDWYNSSATLNDTDTLITGANPINLQRLKWTGANFYYKIQLTADASGDASPVLDDVNVVINATTPALVAEYKLNEGTGTIANNSVSGGSSLNGAITNGAWTTNGKFGNALQFNGTSSYISVSTAITGIRTISFWVNPVNTTTSLIDFDGGTHTITASGGVITTTGFAAPVIYVNAVRGATLHANTWQHILITTTYADTFNSTTITLGKVGTNYFNGLMDEVRIYNNALSPAQVKVDYNQGLALSEGVTNTPKGTSPTVYYKFDEGQGTVANNSSNGGPTGTITSGTWNINGKFSKALTFTASTSVIATLAIDPAYSNTLSLWVYPTTSIASKTIVTNLTTSSASKPVYGGCTGTALTLNTWTHIVAESDGASICKIYQNGVLTSSGTTGVTFGTSLNIGATSFVGSIDEFKLYYYPLTANEVKVDYNHGLALSLGSSTGYCPPGTTCVTPIGEWNFDENTGTGVATGTTVVQGKIGLARNFMASDNITATITDPGYANTLEAWVYPTTSAASKTIITNLTTDSSSRPIYGGCTGTTLPLNSWTFISAVSTDSTHCTLYQNGIASSGSTGVTYGTTVNMGATSFTGKLDEVKIFNYPRTSAQVAWDYNQGKPIARWKFNETSGSVANDSSGNYFTGAITAATFVAGKLNNALSFDGSTAYVSATVSKSINSVSFWMQQNTTSDKSIIDLDGGTHKITIASNAIVATGFSTPTIYIDGIVKSAITDTNWHHITITSNTAFTAGTVTIGKVSTNFFPGMLDDVRLYNYPLTSTQVKILYNNGAID